MVKLVRTSRTKKRVTFDISLDSQDTLEIFRHAGFRLKWGTAGKWDPPNKVVYVSKKVSSVTVSASNFGRIQNMVNAYNMGADSAPGRGGKKVVAKKKKAPAKKVIAKKKAPAKKVIVKKKSPAKKKAPKRVSITGNKSLGKKVLAKKKAPVKKEATLGELVWRLKNVSGAKSVNLIF